MIALLNVEDRVRKPASAMNEQQAIFDHLQQCLRDEAPERVIERYRKLFLYGSAYPLPRILSALERLAARMQTPREREVFAAFIGRCWYMAVHAWLDRPDRQNAIVQLAELFDEVPPITRSRSTNRVRAGVRAFALSPQCLRLRRLGRTIAESLPESEREPKKNAGTVGSSLVRYPFLYEYCFLREDDSKTYRKRILQARETNQQRFEERLSRYAVGLIRDRLTASPPDDPSRPLEEKDRALKAVRNPTMLSHDNLVEALQQLLGKTAEGESYEEIARRFNLRAAQCETYREFKTALCEYAIAATKPKYADLRLRKALQQYFEKLQPHQDDEFPDSTLQQRTYCQLLNFLVVESTQEAGALLYLDAIAQQGVLKTIVLLLKIVLLAPEKVGPHLEKRFGILVDRFDGTPRSEVSWLVKSLEFWQLAHTIYFREADLSIWKQLF